MLGLDSHGKSSFHTAAKSPSPKRRVLSLIFHICSGVRADNFRVDVALTRRFAVCYVPFCACLEQRIRLGTKYMGQAQLAIVDN